MLILFEEDGMNQETFAGVELYRPRLSSELHVRQKAEAHIRSKYDIGSYAKRDEINEILQHVFRFYDGYLKQLLPEIASRDLMAFVLAQYDASAEIDAFHRRNALSAAEVQSWQELSPKFRRAAKYMAECITTLAPEGAPRADATELLDVLDRCWICAEELVTYSILSTQTFVLFPEETTLTIGPIGETDYLTLSVTDSEKYERFSERIQRDTAARRQYIDEDSLLYSFDRIGRYVDGPMEAACGFPFSKALGFLANGNSLLSALRRFNF